MATPPYMADESEACGCSVPTIRWACARRHCEHVWRERAQSTHPTTKFVLNVEPEDRWREPWKSPADIDRPDQKVHHLVLYIYDTASYLQKIQQKFSVNIILCPRSLDKELALP